MFYIREDIHVRLTSHNLELVSRSLDFNAGVENKIMKAFCNAYCLRNLTKQPFCFKNLVKPSCTDLILTSKSRYFQATCVTETGLSDFHGMTIKLEP